MINLRRPSQAYIADGSITKEKIAAGAVDASKIEDGAVDLTSAKVVGELPEAKLADSAVTTNKIADNAVEESKIADGSILEAKIADLAISTEKLKDNVVTLAKANDDVRVGTYVGGEEEQSVTGDIETGIIETGFAKVSNKFAPSKLRVIASLKTSEETGYLKVYIDDEVAARISVSTESNSYELVSGEADITDLSAGRHNVVIKIYGTLGTTVVNNDYVDILFVK